MQELLRNCGVAEETIKILEAWIAWIMQNAGPGGTPFVHAILDAVRQAHEGGGATSAPHPGSPLIAPATAAPVTLQVPGIAPVTASFGRASKGPSPGPLAHQGPPPPNVRITPAGAPSGGAHVQISPAPGAQMYTGELQPGQQRVLITLPDGTEEPPILIDKDHRVLTPIPGGPVAAGPLANPSPPTAAAAAAPGTLTGAMEALKIAGQLGPKQIEAMQAIQRGEDSPLASVLIALDLVELSEGALVLSEKGRTALAVAVSRAPATLAPPAPEAP